MFSVSKNPVPDWVRLREDFPILNQSVHGRPLIYFDSAASSQKPRAVIDALRHYYEHDNANVHRGLHVLSSRATEAFESARSKVAHYLGASSAEEIVFTRGTTESVNLVAQAWGGKFIKEGDVILLTELEHHSNLVPWQLLAQRTGAKLRFLPVQEDGTLAVGRLGEFLTPGVKLFAFTHISNSVGTINPVAEFCKAAKEVGAVTLVDAAQSAGHMPLNVQEIGCDFLAFSGHKMCAPTGIGVLYGRAERLEETPPWHGGGEMILNVTYEKCTFKSPPYRFEAGTPNIADAVGLGAAIDYIESIGREHIFNHDQRLAHYAFDRMSELPGMRILGPKENRGGMISFVMDAAHPHDLTTFADQYGLAMRGGHHCCQPLMRKFRLPGTTRASFYFYNTRDEVDQMVDILGAANRFFCMNPELEELYQQVLLDHSKRPRNYGEIEGAVRVHGDNPSCGDEINLDVQFGAEGKVEDVKFTGQGCAISQASASMMTTKLRGKSREEATEMLRSFQDLIMKDVPEPPKMLGDLRLMQGVRKFPQRVKCAMLAWRAFEEALERVDGKGEGEVSTEAGDPS